MAGETQIQTLFFLFLAAFSPSQWRAALLGIAQRHICIKYNQKPSQRDGRNSLPSNIKTIGDWIRAKRIEKNLTPGHVAAKMGIAQSLVRSWERGAKEPNEQQLAVLRDLLDAKPLWQTGHGI